MAFNIEWDKAGEKKYETGTDRGVVYPYEESGYGEAVAWTGLRLVTQSPDGAEETALYADNMKYLSLLSAENFKGTIGAYTAPDVVEVLDGTVSPTKGVMIGQQARGTFGFSYRTLIGNDVKKNAYGYRLHLVYGATISPSERSYESVNDTPAAIELSWDFTTTPVEVGNGLAPSAHIVIDSTKVTAADLQKFETMLYGNDTTPGKLPMPSEVIAAFTDSSAGGQG